ncbi:MAG: hypothetical protein AB1656_10995 [Candidatus Omnitrophota bacterium]
MQNPMKPTRLFLFAALFWSGCEESRDALLSQADACMQKQELAEASALYLALYHRNPFDADALLGLMKTSHRQENEEEYIHWSLELLKVQPWNREANLAAAPYFARQGKWDDAMVSVLMAFQDSVFKEEKLETIEVLQKITTGIQADIQTKRKEKS